MLAGCGLPLSRICLATGGRAPAGGVAAGGAWRYISGLGELAMAGARYGILWPASASQRAYACCARATRGAGAGRLLLAAA